MPTKREIAAMMRDVCCSKCGVGKVHVRDNHLETCPELPPGETAEWERPLQ